MNNFFIDFHADDYGLSENSDNEIIELCKTGKLNSISIIPNLNIFYNAVDKIEKQKDFFPKPVNISVHLNFMEGKPISQKNLLHHIVNKEGFFCISWGRLLYANYNPFLRNKVKSELKTEIISQIRKCVDIGVIDKNKIRIDSHQHPHMIPVFQDALFEVIEEFSHEHYTIEYIRVSYDPFFLYLRTGVLLSLPNIIKCIILNLYSRKLVKSLRKNNMKSMILCGVALSGKMDNRLYKTLPQLIKYAQRKEKNIEILFHPGSVKNTELTEEFTKPGFNIFHVSNNRHIEFETLKDLVK